MLGAAFVLLFAFPLMFGCSTSGSREATKPRVPLDTVEQIVNSFVADVTALSTTFPELTGFPKRNSDQLSATHVQFSKGLRSYHEMRGVRTTDLEPKGIYLNFMVRPKDDPVWTECTEETLICLESLDVDLYSSFTLSPQASPGREEKLTEIFRNRRQDFRDLGDRAKLKPKDPP
jgi:hypothetical protein